MGIDLESESTLLAVVKALMDRFDALEAKLEAYVNGLSATIEVKVGKKEQ